MYTVIEQISINEWWELGCPLLTRGFKRKQKEKPRVIHVLLDCACMNAKSLQSCLTLCDPMDCSPSGSSVHGILQARILEWVSRPSSRGSSWPRDGTQVSCIAGRCFIIWDTRAVPPYSGIAWDLDKFLIGCGHCLGSRKHNTGVATDQRTQHSH